MMDLRPFRKALLTVVWTAVATMAVVASVRADTIEEKAAVCSGCHGENGIPVDKAIPIIWGQMEGYIYLELRDFKKGVRANEIMGQIASTLERDDMKELAAYFAAKPWPFIKQPAASDDLTRVAMTANLTVGCSGCHLDTFLGSGTTPRIANQNHDYLVKTLADFRSGARANNPGMTSLAKSAHQDEIDALTAYVAGL